MKVGQIAGPVEGHGINDAATERLGAAAAETCKRPHASVLHAFGVTRSARQTGTSVHVKQCEPRVRAAVDTERDLETARPEHLELRGLAALDDDSIALIEGDRRRFAFD